MIEYLYIIKIDSIQAFWKITLNRFFFAFAVSTTDVVAMPVATGLRELLTACLCSRI